MKFRNIYLAVALLATSVAFTACSDDDEWNQTGGGKVEMTSPARAFILMRER